jgi:hypothetical protein
MKWNEQTGLKRSSDGPALARHRSLTPDRGDLAGRLASITLIQGRQGAFKHEKQYRVLSHNAAPPCNWPSQNLNEQFLSYRIQEYTRFVNEGEIAFHMIVEQWQRKNLRFFRCHCSTII